MKLLIAAVVLCAGASPALAVTYSVEPLLQANNAPFSAVGLGEDGTVLGRSSATLQALVRAPDGTLTELPGVGGARSVARRINASGTIVGSGRTGATSATSRPIVWALGQAPLAITLPAGGVFGTGNDINDAGKVVGVYANTAQTENYAFTWTAADGFAQLPSLPGARNTWAEDVNAGGEVAGWLDGNGFNFAARWGADNALQLLPHLDAGNAQSFGSAINDGGTIVGESFLSSTGPIFNIRHGVAWTATNQIVDIGTLAGDNISGLFDINNNGVAVGYSATIDQFGFVSGVRPITWTLGGGIQLFDTTGLGISLEYLNNINDRGQIIASISPGNLVLLTPQTAAVPEPMSWAMMTAGFGLLGWQMRRRARPMAAA
jgi:uncharacterized membrane protein